LIIYYVTKIDKNWDNLKEKKSKKKKPKKKPKKGGGQGGTLVLP
jgi:hypothetical protein